jgi:hypothetical protein
MWPQKKTISVAKVMNNNLLYPYLIDFLKVVSICLWVLLLSFITIYSIANIVIFFKKLIVKGKKQ